MNRNHIIGLGVTVAVIVIGAVVWLAPKGFSQNIPSNTTGTSTDLFAKSIAIQKSPNGTGYKVNINFQNKVPKPGNLKMDMIVEYNNYFGENFQKQFTVPAKATTISQSGKLTEQLCKNKTTGTSTVSVILDKQNKVTETNEGNNIVNYGFYCNDPTKVFSLGYPIQPWIYGVPTTTTTPSEPNLPPQPTGSSSQPTGSPSQPTGSSSKP